MTPEVAYQEYVAVKNHFSNPQYDYFKYNGHTRTTLTSFDARNDIIHFEKLSRHYDPVGLLVAHLAENPAAWIGDILNNSKPYYEHQGVLNSLSRTFLTELVVLNNFDETFRCQPKQVPELIRLYLGRKISLETITILNDLTGIIGEWRKTYNPALLMIIEPLCHRIEKYLPFLRLALKGGYTREKYIEIVNDFLRSKT